MNEETCRHQREKLRGVPQSGACWICCPWMFPNGSPEARLAYAQWHINEGIPLPRAWRKREEDMAFLERRYRTA